jgi:hypothetical protein
MNVTLNGFTVLSNMNLYESLSYRNSGSYAFRMLCPDGVLTIQFTKVGFLTCNKALVGYPYTLILGFLLQITH